MNDSKFYSMLLAELDNCICGECRDCEDNGKCGKQTIVGEIKLRIGKLEREKATKRKTARKKANTSSPYADEAIELSRYWERTHKRKAGKGGKDE